MSHPRPLLRSVGALAVMQCALVLAPAALAGPPGAPAPAALVRARGKVPASPPKGAAPAAGPKGAASAKRPAGKTSTGPAAPKTPSEEARRYFDQGVAAHDKGKLADAERLFGQAWALQRSWDIAANLGLVERRLGKDAQAAEHLSFALAALPPSEPERTRKNLARELEAASAKAGKLTVRSAVAGAVVRAGGRLRGTTPLEGPLFEAPGRIRIEVTKEGFETAAQEVTVEAGGAVEVTLSPAPAARSGSGRALAGPAIAFGTAGLGLVTGLVAGGIAASTMDDLRRACGPDLVCPEAHRGQADLGRAAAHTGTAGFVMAGVGAAVGLTLLLVQDRAAPAKVGLSVGPGFVGATARF